MVFQVAVLQIKQQYQLHAFIEMLKIIQNNVGSK